MIGCYTFLYTKRSYFFFFFFKEVKLRVYRKTVRLAVCLRPPLKILLTLIVKETGYASEGCCNSSSSRSRTKKKKKNWTGFCRTLGPLCCHFIPVLPLFLLRRDPSIDQRNPVDQDLLHGKLVHLEEMRLMTDKSQLFTENLSAVPPARPSHTHRTALCNAALLKLKSTLAQLRH